MRKAYPLSSLPAVAAWRLQRRSAAKPKSLDEFAVARNAPLVIPPDYSLTPPVAGTVSLSAQDAQTQAIEALFGGPAPRSATETSRCSSAPAATAPRSASARPPAIPTRASSTRARRPRRSSPRRKADSAGRVGPDAAAISGEKGEA